MPRPLVAAIDCASLQHNLSMVRWCAPGKKVWAVVKANAYGHGLQLACEGFSKADGLALIEWDRAQWLRCNGWAKPILLLEGAFDLSDTQLAIQENLSLVVHCWKQVAWLEASAPVPLEVGIYLKVNSGMNRLGFQAEELLLAYERLRRLTSSIVLMTHFANADQTGGDQSAQERFLSLIKQLPPTVYSLANSGTILSGEGGLSAANNDALRPGIMLYGATPFADCVAADFGLKPAMSLRSELLAVQHLNPGDAVGYGGRFRADRAMRIGIVAAGYGDGYPRSAPDGTPVSVGGVTTRLVGRVSMDMLAVDLFPVPLAQPGTPVELWGTQIPIDTVARAAGTIGYELMCALSQRVPVIRHTGEKADKGSACAAA